MSSTQPLDLLIVGGGPAGIAAAVRGRELGLSVMVIETDDLMRRIRDYSKEKLILPSFGGGSRMAFPAGDSSVSQLAFAPIDKDELCARYRKLCTSCEIQYRVGVELTGLDWIADGFYAAKAYDHRERRELSIHARHVALALGRGVPRSFDIPGDTEGISLRLDDPERYVGAPACVVGGGTSAAEAVISISNSKAAAGDPTAVHWSYRGDKLPRVSKALAEVFFEAYAGNGNIRYHPHSEPLMTLPGDDRRSHLAIRIDRRQVPGRSTEASLLEIPNESVIACIGEDLPEGFLRSMGIYMAVGGPRGRKRMVVNRYLETIRPQVYLLGDILSQAYLEADSFHADPGTFREIKHRGNIKSALRDGVLVAQIVRQRLDGVTAVDTRVADSGSPEPEAPTSSVSAVMSAIFDRPLAELAAPPPEAASAWLVRFMPSGAESEEYPLAAGCPTTLGRHGCDLCFPDDAHLSPRHASVTLDCDRAVLRDEGAEAGVFRVVPSRRKIELRHGDLLRAGRQFLLVEGTAGAYRLIHFDAQGQEQTRHAAAPGSMVFGRKGCDVVLDAGDGTLSRRQLAISLDRGRLLVKDLMSANGTLLRVQGQTRLEHGDQFLVGQQRFTFSSQQDAVLDSGPAQSTSAFQLPHTAQASQTPPPVPGGPSVTFQPLGKICPVTPGQTLLEVAEANGLKIVAECRSGICGSDPIRVLKGRENLEPAPDAGESETLEDLCGLEPGPCRLACKARVRGPVVVEILEQ